MTKSGMVGVGTRSEVVQKRTVVRIVKIFLFNGNGKMVLSKALEGKRLEMRELWEKFGIRTPLKEVGGYTVVTSRGRSLTKLFMGKVGSFEFERMKQAYFYPQSYSAR